MKKTNYQPFGPEWVTELMKLPKGALIALYRIALQRLLQYQIVKIDFVTTPENPGEFREAGILTSNKGNFIVYVKKYEKPNQDLPASSEESQMNTVFVSQALPVGSKALTCTFEATHDFLSCPNVNQLLLEHISNIFNHGKTQP